MPPPESLSRPGTPVQRKGLAPHGLMRRFGRQPAAVWGCGLVAECGLVCGWCGGSSGPYGVASMFAKICCGATCHPVTAISVVPGSGTTQAVWMPGL